MSEPLHLSAPLSAAYARDHCLSSEGRDGGCAWYHGGVQYLRMLGLVADPGTHRDFHADAFGHLARAGGFDRVLVSGAADYSMAAQVIDAYRAAGAEPHLTVVDHCPTPLYINEWYAGQIGADVTTRVAAILDYRADAPYDVICTHCFLGYFTADERPRLAARWYALLRPGGRVVTVAPVRPAATGERSYFEPDQAASFEDRAEAAARAGTGQTGLAPADARRLAEGFTANFWSYPVRSEAELRGLFEGAGFVVERLDGISPPEEARGTAAGPTEHGLEFAKIELLRP